jgi:hypothetical protein
MTGGDYYGGVRRTKLKRCKKGTRAKYTTTRRCVRKASGYDGGDYYGGAKGMVTKSWPRSRCPKGRRVYYARSCLTPAQLKARRATNKRIKARKAKAKKGAGYDGGDYYGGDYDGGDYDGGDWIGMHGMGMMPYGGVRAGYDMMDDGYGGVLLGGAKRCPNGYRRGCVKSGSKTAKPKSKRKGKKATGLRARYIDFVKQYQVEHLLSYAEALEEISRHKLWDQYKIDHGL